MCLITVIRYKYKEKVKLKMEERKMGNLGLYQVMTTCAKKVGGPEKLLALVALGGYGVLRVAEAGGRRVMNLGYRIL